MNPRHTKPTHPSLLVYSTQKLIMSPLISLLILALTAPSINGQSLTAVLVNASLPTRQGSMGGFHLAYGENTVYIVGGLDVEAARKDTILEFNLSSQSWRLVGTQAIPTNDGFTVRRGGDEVIHFGGMARIPGQDPSSPIQILNTTSGEVSLAGQFPGGYHRSAAVAQVSLNKVLIFGDSWLDPLSTRIIELDLLTLATTSIASLPEGNYYYAAFWTGEDEVYIVASRGILKYTISNNTVSDFLHRFEGFILQDFPAVAWDTQNIYIVGGQWRFGDTSVSLLRYDVGLNRLSIHGLAGLPTIWDQQYRKGTTVCDQVTRRIYLIGGSTYPGVYRDEIWYIPIPTWE